MFVQLARKIHSSTIDEQVIVIACYSFLPYPHLCPIAMPTQNGACSVPSCASFPHGEGEGEGAALALAMNASTRA